jgi:hypothetical protein
LPTSLTGARMHLFSSLAGYRGPFPPTYIWPDPARRTLPRAPSFPRTQTPPPRWNGRALPPSSVSARPVICGRCNPFPPSLAHQPTISTVLSASALRSRPRSSTTPIRHDLGSKLESLPRSRALRRISGSMETHGDARAQHRVPHIPKQDRVRAPPSPTPPRPRPPLRVLVPPTSLFHHPRSAHAYRAGRSKRGCVRTSQQATATSGARISEAALHRSDLVIWDTIRGGAGGRGRIGRGAARAAMRFYRRVGEGRASPH